MTCVARLRNSMIFPSCSPAAKASAANSSLPTSRSTPRAEELRALRTQLLMRWSNAGVSHRVLAVVSPGPSEGRSYVAANLAVVFSQLGERTLLIDADLRTP